MTRLSRWLVAAPLAIAVLALAGGGATLAAGPSGQPAAAGTTTSGSGAYDLAAEPALPYVAALLVTSAGLSLVGFVAMRAQQRQRTPAGRHLEDGWWTCDACEASNPADRRTCFACRAARGSPPDAHPIPDDIRIAVDEDPAAAADGQPAETPSSDGYPA